eukprot:8776858-Pyramimonas_sp.AAC.1
MQEPTKAEGFPSARRQGWHRRRRCSNLARRQRLLLCGAERGGHRQLLDHAAGREGTEGAARSVQGE